MVVPDQELDGVIDYVDRENVANSLANELYSALGNKPEFRPDGVSLISEKIKVDLLDLPKAAQRSGFKNADQVLNPDGFVIIYLKMYNPGNGRYRVRIKANDEYICEFYVETLIPEESEFVYPQSMIHFKDKKEP